MNDHSRARAVTAWVIGGAAVLAVVVVLWALIALSTPVEEKVPGLAASNPSSTAATSPSPSPSSSNSSIGDVAAVASQLISQTVAGEPPDVHVPDDVKLLQGSPARNGLAAVGYVIGEWEQACIQVGDGATSSSACTTYADYEERGVTYDGGAWSVTWRGGGVFDWQGI